MDEDILAILFIGFTVLTPVAGLTIRMALKPVVDSIARLLELRMKSATTELLERRIDLLEQEVHSLRADRERLSDERDFYRQLKRSETA
jgi:hypothetical protein